MAFAIFYNLQDLTPIAANATRVDLKGTDKTLALKIWNGGLKGWSIAPIAPLDRQEGDPDTRIVVISATNVTLQNMIDLLIRLSAQPGAAYLARIASDMSRSSGAVEPWPPV